MKKFIAPFLMIALQATGQNTIGLPDVINYPKKAYGAGLQTWDISQDSRGIIYMANNEGVLSYDGQYWAVHPLPNRTIVRSVAVSRDHRVYAGGQDEIGYFEPDRSGNLVFRSLIPLIKQSERSFGDVWDIVLYGNAVFFRTQSRIFRYADQAITSFPAPQEWSYIGVSGDQVLAHDYQQGILRFTDNSWQPLYSSNTLPPDPVTAILEINPDSSLLTTLKSGVFFLTRTGISPFRSPALEKIRQDRIYTATLIQKNWVAFGTNQSGVQITDTRGNLIQQFTKSEGLQNNNVLSIFLDQQRNLWLGLDNGIDFIAYNSAIKRISPDNQGGSGYTAIIHGQTLYAGTSGGLFSVPLQPVQDLSFSMGQFRPVSNTDGQVWGLQVINNILLMGHHEGAFVVEGNAARPLYNTGKGVWNFIPLSQVFPVASIVSGTYRGLTFFNFNGSRFEPAENIPGLDESCRFVAIADRQVIWVSHPYHGVYRVSRDAAGRWTSRLFTAAEGLPSTLNNHVYKINNEVLVATVKGIYVFDEASARFSPSAFYRKLLGDESIRYLREDKEGNIWFIREKNLSVLDRSGGSPRLIPLPELNNKLLSGFEFIYPVSAANVFIGGEKGLYLVNYEKYRKNLPGLHVMIRSVHIYNSRDSLLYGGYSAGSSQPEGHSIRYKWGNPTFVYASPLYGQQDNLEFSYRLKGFNDNWSEWSPRTEKEFTHLPAGRYQFEVKVRNNLGNESAPATFPFRIMPPWHQTTWAYAAYIILLLGGVYWLYRWQLRKFRLQQEKYEKEQAQLQYMHQLEIDKASNELVALRNEKLQVEVDFKNAELATNAMHLVQKSELLAKIRAELNQLLRAVDNDKAQAEIRKLVKVLGEDEKMDKDWEHFSLHFDKVHSDFLVQLKEKFPSVTPNELKLSAYLRMNMSTKEIAQLMNISVRGVEISRYRLRKKLGISSEVNLFDFLMGIKGEGPASFG